MKDTPEDQPRTSQKSPYSKKDGSAPKLLTSVVCYADILGFKELIRSATAGGRLDELFARLKAATDDAYSFFRQAEEPNVDGTDRYALKTFTDNVVVGYPIRGDGEGELGSVFLAFQFVQVSFIQHGFLLRGAIALGEHYMDEDIVFGDALLEATDHDTTGGGPRIVVAKSARDAVASHMRYYSDPRTSPQAKDLLQDTDGEWFLDYLRCAFDAYPDFPVITEVLDYNRRLAVDGLELYAGNRKVLPKYQWLAAYHDFVCERFAAEPIWYTEPPEDVQREQREDVRRRRIKPEGQAAGFTNIADARE